MERQRACSRQVNRCPRSSPKRNQEGGIRGKRREKEGGIKRPVVWGSGQGGKGKGHDKGDSIKRKLIPGFESVRVEQVKVICG